MYIEAENICTDRDQSRLDGGNGEVWEPVWHLPTRLLPVEQDLLRSFPLRRLHFIHSSGPSYIHTQHTYSRLQHTLGVFALVAYFCPDNIYLRVAALLHDVGHAPFSHMLDALDGINHHQWTNECLNTSPIADILHAHQLKPNIVLEHIEGHPENLLRNSKGLVCMDHLDSWVRNAHSAGCLPIAAPQILGRLRTTEVFLETDEDVAMIILNLIFKEARLICSAANIGSQAVLSNLVQQLLNVGVVNVSALPKMTDGSLEHLLLTTPETADEAQRLWYKPDELIVRKADHNPHPENAHIVTIENLYAFQPLVNGQPVADICPKANKILQEINQLRGEYIVHW